LATSVQALIRDLMVSDQHEPFPPGALGAGSYLTWLDAEVQGWAKANGASEEIRYKGKGA
jgi:hypothetical protein